MTFGIEECGREQSMEDALEQRTGSCIWGRPGEETRSSCNEASWQGAPAPADGVCQSCLSGGRGAGKIVLAFFPGLWHSNQCETETVSGDVAQLGEQLLDV